MSSKIVAYYALHYGCEWLYWSMRAIRDVVDDIVVTYTPVPSYGHSTDVPCPESRDNLKAIADQFNAHWYDAGSLRGEGIHRDYTVDLCQKNHGADIVLPVDFDELWDPDHLLNVLFYVDTDPKMHRTYRVPMQHYWRSVSRVCRDPLQPVRVIVPGRSNADDHYISPGSGYMHHFGYAQSPSIVKYKWLIHGHKTELRDGWLEETFMRDDKMLDLHPTNVDFWNAAYTDKLAIGHLIGDHPYYSIDIIDNSVVDALRGVSADSIFMNRTKFGFGL